MLWCGRGRGIGRRSEDIQGFMKLSIELDREDDGRWIAEALELPGVMTYGATREEAISNTERLARGDACFGAERLIWGSQ